MVSWKSPGFFFVSKRVGTLFGWSVTKVIHRDSYILSYVCYINNLYRMEYTSIYLQLVFHCCCITVLEDVQATESTVTNEERSKKFEADDVVANDTAGEAVDCLQTGFDKEEMLHHSNGASARAGSSSVSKTPDVLKSGKSASGRTRTKFKQNSAGPTVANGVAEAENSNAVETCINSEEVGTNLYESSVLSATFSDAVASGDHRQPQPVSPGSSCTEPNAGFTEVVRRRRKDTAAKQKAQQSNDLCSFWPRRPARPAYASPGSNFHHAAGRSLPIHVQPVAQKVSNSPAVELWDSTQSAFPALPSQRVRRNSTGDVPATSDSNTDGSDLDSVKSLQTSTSWRTGCDHPLGTSSYASVVVGSVSGKEPVSANVSQLGTNTAQKSPCLNAHQHGYNLPSFNELTVRASPLEVANSASSVTDRFATSDFMVDSSIDHEDRSCTDGEAGHGERQTESRSVPRSRVRRHGVLFFDTRSKMSNTPVPSLDISFGFDESMASETTSADSTPVTGDTQRTDATTEIPQGAQMTSVDDCRSPPVACPPNSSSTSTASLPRSSFDLRAAQRFLLSGEC